MPNYFKQTNINTSKTECQTLFHANGNYDFFWGTTYRRAHFIATKRQQRKKQGQNSADLVF